MVILQTQEQSLLQQHFWIASPDDMVRGQTYNASELLDEKRLFSLIQQHARQLETNSLITTAAHLSKQYAYMLVVPVLYTMSAINKGLDASIDNIQIHFKQENGNTVWELNLKNWNASIPGSNREVWREQLVRDLFENLACVWQALQTLTGVSRFMMWENTANYIYWLYEDKLQDLSSDRKKQAQEDFHYLLYEVPAEAFLETFQPLYRYYHPKVHVAWSEQPIRLRKTCCLYYQLNAEGQCCHSCPRKYHRKSV